MRILIVSPHFPPSNAADMQRVRMLLPYFQQNGVEVEVLAVDPAQVASPLDPWLDEGLPPEVPIHRVKALPLTLAKVPGLGTLSFRALKALKQKASSLLAEKTIDLIYFSTTQFSIQTLGPYLKKRFGVPFAMDYQDPWVSDYYREHSELVPPGGRLKYGIAEKINRWNEPRTLRHCSGITSVSPEYPKQLERRYGLGLPSLVVPFPGDSADLDRVKKSDIRQTVFDSSDGKKHWVYVGRGGGDMALAVRGIFATIQKIDTSNLQLHFIGTSYAQAGQGLKTIEPLAAEFGLEQCVFESPDRIPYSQTLRCLLDADGLIVPGSDDPAYTASKIYPYLLADKPLLTVFHENSSVTRLIQSVGGGSIISFNEESSAEEIASDIKTSALSPDGALKHVSLDPIAFEPYNAQSQALKLKAFFETLVK